VRSTARVPAGDLGQAPSREYSSVRGVPGKRVDYQLCVWYMVIPRFPRPEDPARFERKYAPEGLRL